MIASEGGPVGGRIATNTADTPVMTIPAVFMGRVAAGQPMAHTAGTAASGATKGVNGVNGVNGVMSTRGRAADITGADTRLRAASTGTRGVAIVAMRRATE